jgi:hypothetical protein
MQKTYSVDEYVHFISQRPSGNVNNRPHAITQEIWQKIFSHLSSLHELKKLSVVCQKFLLLSTSNTLFTRVLRANICHVWRINHHLIQDLLMDTWAPITFEQMMDAKMATAQPLPGLTVLNSNLVTIGEFLVNFSQKEITDQSHKADPDNLYRYMRTLQAIISLFPASFYPASSSSIVPEEKICKIKLGKILLLRDSFWSKRMAHLEYYGNCQSIKG